MQRAFHKRAGVRSSRLIAYLKRGVDPKRKGRGSKGSSPTALALMIFGFSTYLPTTKSSGQKAREQATGLRPVPQVGETNQSDRERARIYDIEHERKLRALHTLIANGATLSEAARLIGISRICAYRWNDYGRR